MALSTHTATRPVAVQTLQATRARTRERRQRDMSRMAEAVEALLSAAGASDHIALCLALLRVARGRRGFKATNAQLGEYLPGDSNASSGSKAKRGQRALHDVVEWQEGREAIGDEPEIPASPYRLVTYKKGGGMDAQGKHHPTEYDFPLIEVAAELDEAIEKIGPELWGEARDAEVRRLASVLVERLRSDAPTVTGRPGVGYGQGGRREASAESELRRAVTAIRKGAGLAGDRAGFFRRVWNELGADLIEAGVLTPDEGLEVEPIPESVQSLLGEYREESGQEGEAKCLNVDHELPGGLTVHLGELPIAVPAPEVFAASSSPLTELLRAGEALLAAGAEAVKVVYTDDEAKAEGRKDWRGDETLTVEELAARGSELLATAEDQGWSGHVRPQGIAGLVHVEDLVEAERAELEPFAFLSIESSPGSYHALLQVDDPATALELLTRLLAGLQARHPRPAGVEAANRGSSGSFRCPGSANRKPKRRQGDGTYPRVRVVSRSLGRVTSLAEIDEAGLLAVPPEPPARPFLCIPSLPSSASAERRGWPSYDRILDEAPAAATHAGPDRSWCDFRFALLALDRGWGASEVMAELLQVSEKARRRGPRYVGPLVEKAARSVSGASSLVN